MRGIAIAFVAMLLLLTAAPAQADARAYQTVVTPQATYYFTSQYMLYRESNDLEGLQEFYRWDDACNCLVIPDTRIWPNSPEFCGPYNPSALTNGCIQTPTERAPGTTVFPVVSVGEREFCPFSTLCFDHPQPGYTLVGDELYLPMPHGYVEATIACSLGAPCRLTLP